MAKVLLHRKESAATLEIGDNAADFLASRGVQPAPASWPSGLPLLAFSSPEGGGAPP
jgi:hypothetical protein